MCVCMWEWVWVRVWEWEWEWVCGWMLQICVVVAGTIAVVDTPAVVVGIGFAAAVILVVLGGDG